MEHWFDLCEKELVSFLDIHPLPKDHGMLHIHRVLSNLLNAILTHQRFFSSSTLSEEIKWNVAMEPRPFTQKEQMLLQLAALLHEVDDTKFFKTTNYAHARTLLQNVHIPEIDVETVIQCISLVSCSENGNSVVQPAWFYLLVRDADRVEALGQIGMDRCYDYTIRKKCPLMDSLTTLALDHSELERQIDPKRLEIYQQTHTSRTMVDHYYDKLFHLNACQSGNAFLTNLTEERMKEMKRVIVQLSNGYATVLRVFPKAVLYGNE